MLKFSEFRFKVKDSDGNKSILDTNDYFPLYPVPKYMFEGVSLKQGKSDVIKKS